MYTSRSRQFRLRSLAQRRTLADWSPNMDFSVVLHRDFSYVPTKMYAKVEDVLRAVITESANLR